MNQSSFNAGIKANRISHRQIVSDRQKQGSQKLLKTCFEPGLQPQQVEAGRLTNLFSLKNKAGEFVYYSQLKEMMAGLGKTQCIWADIANWVNAAPAGTHIRPIYVVSDAPEIERVAQELPKFIENVETDLERAYGNKPDPCMPTRQTQATGKSVLLPGDTQTYEYFIDNVASKKAFLIPNPIAPLRSTGSGKPLSESYKSSAGDVLLHQKAQYSLRAQKEGKGQFQEKYLIPRLYQPVTELCRRFLTKRIAAKCDPGTLDVNDVIPKVNIAAYVNLIHQIYTAAQSGGKWDVHTRNATPNANENPNDPAFVGVPKVITDLNSIQRNIEKGDLINFLEKDTKKNTNYETPYFYVVHVDRERKKLIMEPLLTSRYEVAWVTKPLRRRD